MTFIKGTFKQITGCVLIALTTSLSLTTPALSAAVGNEVIVSDLKLSEARQTVDSFMLRQDVRQQIQNLGVDPEEALARVNALDDDEVVALAERINSGPAGQGAVGAIVGTALVVFVVLLITDLLGFTDVFPFTNKGSANPS